MTVGNKVSDYSVKLNPQNIPKKKLATLTEKTHTTKASPYISSSHQKYCSTYDMSYIEQPIVKTISWVFVPFKYLVHQNSLSLDKPPVFAHMFPSDEDDDINIVEHKNNYNQNFLKTQSLMNDIVINYPWFKKQQDYVMSLPQKYIYTLRGYTYTGDVFANNYLRGSFDKKLLKGVIDTFVNSDEAFFPLFFQMIELIHQTSEYDDIFETLSAAKSARLVSLPKASKLPKKLTVKEWFTFLKNTSGLKNSDKYVIILSLWEHMKFSFVEKCVQMFIKDLQYIFRNAPPLKNEMTVFRGVKDDYYLRGSKNGFYKNNGFISTSMDYTVAEVFRSMNENSKQELGCCIQSIIIKPGTKVIPLIYVSIFGGEKEILIDHGSMYHITAAKNVKLLYNNPKNAASSICFKKTHKVIVSDITLTSS